MEKESWEKAKILQSKLRYYIHRFNCEEEKELDLQKVEILMNLSSIDSKSTFNKNYGGLSESESSLNLETKPKKQTKK